MAKKKVTIKDVAREAGVSTAAVSYVMNNRTDVRISDETRKKILQVINLLDYTPNQAARSLVANKKSIFAIYIPASDSILIEAEYMRKARILTDFFHRNSYETILLNDDDPGKCDQADAIICIDSSSDEFRRLGDSNFIPLVALDCMINDSLFFQVNDDPERIISEAETHFGHDFHVLMLRTPNLEKISFYRRYFKHLEIISSMADALHFSDQNVVVLNWSVYSLMSERTDLLYLPSLSDSKLTQLLSCIEKAMSRKPAELHDILV